MEAGGRRDHLKVVGEVIGQYARNHLAAHVVNATDLTDMPGKPAVLDKPCQHCLDEH